MPVLKYYDGVSVKSLLTGPQGPPGTTDHNLLINLDSPNDDHPQYARTDGTRGLFASLAQGAKADSAIQPDATYTVALNKISVLSQLQYNGIGTKDPNTLYLIV